MPFRPEDLVSCTYTFHTKKLMEKSETEQEHIFATVSHVIWSFRNWKITSQKINYLFGLNILLQLSTLKCSS